MIIVWDESASGEYGAWTPQDDPVTEALAHVHQVISQLFDDQG